MAGIRLAPFRAEISSNFDSGESAQIGSFKYDPSSTMMFAPTSFQGDETATSGKPVRIYEYEFQCATTTLTQMWQSYADDDDHSFVSNWDPSSMEFLQGLKQNKLVAGNKARYVSRWNEELIGEDLEADQFNENLDWKVGTIRFKARHNGKKGRRGRWIVPPIDLNLYKKNVISWHIANVGNTDDAHYYCSLRIKKWKQMV